MKINWHHRIWYYISAVASGIMGVIGLMGLLMSAPYPRLPYPVAHYELAIITTIFFFVFMLLLLVFYLEECRDHTLPENRLGPRMKRQFQRWTLTVFSWMQYWRNNWKSILLGLTIGGAFSLLVHAFVIPLVNLIPEQYLIVIAMILFMALGIGGLVRIFVAMIRRETITIQF